MSAESDREVTELERLAEQQRLAEANRLLDQLVREGKAEKFITADGDTCYRMIRPSHI